MTKDSIPDHATKIIGVYTITCTANGRVYVGSSIDVQRRLRQHTNMLSRNGHSNTHMQRAWNKYGAAAFMFVIVDVCAAAGDLLPVEKRWIERLDAVNNGFNQKSNPASSLGVKWSDEARYRQSITMRGKSHPHSEESKRNISAALRGREFSEEHRGKISKAMTGKPLSEEARRKISAAFRGKKTGPKSDETKRKLSDAKRGRKLSDEHKRKISEGVKRNGIAPYLTNAKLRPEDVAVIKSLLAQGVKGADIARKYDVRPQVISDIKCNRKWSHITPLDK